MARKTFNKGSGKSFSKRKKSKSIRISKRKKSKSIRISKNKKSKKKKYKNKKSTYSSIAKGIDAAIDSYFNKTKKPRSGGRGPFSVDSNGEKRTNPRVQLQKKIRDKKELGDFELSIIEESRDIIKEANRLGYGASKLTGVAMGFIEKKIIDDINKSLKTLKSSGKKEDIIDFLKKSLLFWNMCKEYPKTAKCENINAEDKIIEYIDKLKKLQ
jgi:hypothetical protein